MRSLWNSMYDSEMIIGRSIVFMRDYSSQHQFFLGKTKFAGLLLHSSAYWIQYISMTSRHSSILKRELTNKQKTRKNPKWWINEMKKYSKELKPLKIRDRKEIISKINTEWESGMKEINRIKIQISSME